MGYLIKKSFYLVWGAGLLLTIVCIFVVGISFIACMLCVIWPLHVGRLGADQWEHDIRPTTIREKKGKNTDANSSECKDKNLCPQDIAKSFFDAFRSSDGQYNYGIQLSSILFT